MSTEALLKAVKEGNLTQTVRDLFIANKQLIPTVRPASFLPIRDSLHYPSVPLKSRHPRSTTICPFLHDPQLAIHPRSFLLQVVDPESGETLLHIACSYGDVTMATELLDHSNAYSPVI